MQRGQRIRQLRPMVGDTPLPVPWCPAAVKLRHFAFQLGTLAVD